MEDLRASQWENLKSVRLRLQKALILNIWKKKFLKIRLSQVKPPEILALVGLHCEIETLDG